MAFIQIMVSGLTNTMANRPFSIGEQIGVVKRQAKLLRGKYEAQLRSPQISDIEKRAARYEVECLEAVIGTLQPLKDDAN